MVDVATVFANQAAAGVKINLPTTRTNYVNQYLKLAFSSTSGTRSYLNRYSRARCQLADNDNQLGRLSGTGSNFITLYTKRWPDRSCSESNRRPEFQIWV